MERVDACVAGVLALHRGRLVLSCERAGFWIPRFHAGLVMHGVAFVYRFVSGNGLDWIGLDWIRLHGKHIVIIEHKTGFILSFTALNRVFL